MSIKGKSVGRAYLVEKLQEQGLSRRDAVRILNFVIDEMVKALRRGEEVEFPFGKLKRVKRHFSKWWDEMDDTPANRSPYAIVYQLDGAWYPRPDVWQRPKKGRGGKRKGGK
jgi:hypothetical protein